MNYIMIPCRNNILAVVKLSPHKEAFYSDLFRSVAAMDGNEEIWRDYRMRLASGQRQNVHTMGGLNSPSWKLLSNYTTIAQRLIHICLNTCTLH